MIPHDCHQNQEQKMIEKSFEITYFTVLVYSK